MACGSRVAVVLRACLIPVVTAAIVQQSGHYLLRFNRETWNMSAVPPNAEPGITSAPDAVAAPAPAPVAVGRSRSRKRRLILLGAVLICLVGTGAFYKWSETRRETNTEAVRAVLSADGIAVIDANGEPDDSPSPFQGWTKSKMVRVQSSVKKITDAEMVKIAGISQDLNLVLSSCPVTDQGLSYLEGMSNVRCLVLTKTAITNDGIKHLRGMNLQTLDLSLTKITDKGLAALGELDFPRLKEISLERTHVTNDGVMHLANFKNLEWISIAGTKVTKEGIRHLKAKLPEATVLD
jgi:hypothetical protein